MARSLCFEIINEFKKFTKNKIKINFKKRREGDMVKIVANTNKLKKILK
jgi:UDP-glucose 4-epimerase|tara:strand:- start:13 stop:159 length:147 start_codon:yes stop_codon:yes gene_type:complete